MSTKQTDPGLNLLCHPCVPPLLSTSVLGAPPPKPSSLENQGLDLQRRNGNLLEFPGSDPSYHRPTLVFALTPDLQPGEHFRDEYSNCNPKSTYVSPSANTALLSES